MLLSGKCALIDERDVCACRKSSFSKYQNILGPSYLTPSKAINTQRYGKCLLSPFFHQHQRDSGAISPLSFGGHREDRILFLWAKRQQL